MNNNNPQEKTMSRRQALGQLGGFALLSSAWLVGCSDDNSSSTSADAGSDTTITDTTASESGATTTTTTTTTTGSGVSTCTLIPEETAGPYPLYSVLSNTAMVRQDITEGRAGVPLSVKLNVVDLNNGCAPISNAYVYLWHCDKDGNYSGYTGFEGETFCRGIQDVDANGQVTFTTLYPGWYRGRITHIHFQVYLNNGLTATSQLAFPADATTEVYNSSLYVAKGQNTSVSSNASDGIFSDGVDSQMVTLSGDIDNGLIAELNVGIAA